MNVNRDQAVKASSNDRIGLAFLFFESKCQIKAELDVGSDAWSYILRFFIHFTIVFFIK